MQETTSGAALTVEALKKEGIKYVFGLPGTTIMPLLDEFYRQDQIRYISVRHEQVAAFMADGYSRACREGDLGVCLASRGPGAANMAIGLHNSFAESIPVLALVGQVPDQFYHREAFEEMDLVKFFEPVTKWSLEIHDTRRIPELLQRAVRTAVGGRPRPVMVSIPFDVLQEKTENVPLLPAFRSRHPLPAQAEIKQAARLLRQAEKPAILLGGGGRRAREKVVLLAELLQAPVVTTWLRKDVFPNDHPLYFGTLGYGAFAVSEQIVKEADVLFAVGCRFSEFTTKKWTLIDAATKIIQADIDPEEIGKIYIPEIGLCGEAALTVSELVQALEEENADAARLEQRKKRLAQLSARLAQEIQLPDTPKGAKYVPSAVIIKALQTVIDRHSPALVMDVPTFGVWAQRYLTIRERDKYYGCGGGSMGWGFPAAMGIKLARPEELVIAVSGDGSFWMVAQDLETAVRENIPVINIIINNFAFGNTRDRQKETYDGRYLGVFYNNPDFAAYAKLLGAYGERVEKAEDLVPALERAMASGKPAVLDVIQDRFEGLPAGLAPIGAK